MRDINRIPHFITKLSIYWMKVPDWRFGQLIENFKTYCGRQDLFYMEDEEFEQLFEDFFKAMKE